GRAGVRMFGENAGGVLDRHLVASERHQARAELLVQGVERRALEIGQNISVRVAFPDAKSAPLATPSVRRPERFAGRIRLTSSVGIRCPQHPPLYRTPS